jgi:hypothetical protein
MAVANEIGLPPEIWESQETMPAELEDGGLAGGPDYSPCHWVLTHGNSIGRRFKDENSFVGLVSRIRALPYVRAKLSQNPKLLRTSTTRIENATLGFKFWSLRKRVNRFSSVPLLAEQRLDIIKYLLRRGANPRDNCTIENNTKSIENIFKKYAKRRVNGDEAAYILPRGCQAF